MGKILDLFNARIDEGTMYRNVPIKPDGSGNAHPLRYVYPDTEESLSEDVVLGESVSLNRDINRMNIWLGQTRYGRKFLQDQKDLQRKNPWAQTRRYREDTVKDHTEDPNLHQQRHGRSLSSLKRDTFGILGEFAAEGNNGRLQTETSYALTKDPGPVKYRMESPEGMLNTGGLTVVGNAASVGRGWFADKANDWLSGATRYLSDFRGTYTDTTVGDRPEIQYGYLEKVYEKNRGLKDDYGITHGQIYLNLPENDGAKTYYDTHPVVTPTWEYSTHLQIDGMGENLGLLGYEQLRPGGQRNRIATRLYDTILSSVEDVIGVGLQHAALWAFGDTRLLREVSSLGSRYLPRFNELEFFNTLREVAVDIDKFIAERRLLLHTVFGVDPNQITLIPTNLKDRYLLGPPVYPNRRSKVLEDVETELFSGVNSPKLQKYITEVEKYKGSNKKISLGFGPGGNTDGLSGFDRKRVFKSSGVRYYKDYTQVDPYGSIYKKHIPDEADTDSIDVIFEVLNDRDDSVRFRAFIENINETVTPTYHENKYIGRYETFYTYDTVTRDLSFNLRLQAFSSEEREHVMKKMAYLTSLAYPESSENYLTPLITKLTIGKVYIEQPCIVQSLSHSIESDTSWDIDEQHPMSILVNLGVRFLDKELYTNKTMGDSNNPFGLYLNGLPMGSGLSGADVLDELFSHGLG